MAAALPCAFGCFSRIRIIPRRTQVFPLLWIVGPFAGSWEAHLFLFFYFGVSSYLAALAHYLEVSGGAWKHRVRRKHTVFICTYGLSWLAVLANYSILLVANDSNAATPPRVPPGWTQTATLSWLACYLLDHTFAPTEPPLRMRLELVVSEDDTTETAGGGGVV